MSASQSIFHFPLMIVILEIRYWILYWIVKALMLSGTLWLSGLAGSIAYNWSQPNMKTSVKIIHARYFSSCAPFSIYKFLKSSKFYICFSKYQGFWLALEVMYSREIGQETKWSSWMFYWFAFANLMVTSLCPMESPFPLLLLTKVELIFE